MQQIVFAPFVISPKQVGVLIGRKSTTVSNVLKEFRAFVARKPKYFLPHFPAEYVVLEIPELDTQYNMYCFLHWYHNRKLLSSGSRSVRPFKEDLPYLKDSFKINLEV